MKEFQVFIIFKGFYNFEAQKVYVALAQYQKWRTLKIEQKRKQHHKNK